MNTTQELMTQSISNEWGTPSSIIEAARETMGGIDLDPCGCKESNRIIRAEKFFTIRDNGMTLPWHGRVWMNPPYGKKSTENFIYGASAWVQRLIALKADGLVNEFCCLVRDSNAKYKLLQFGCWSCEPDYRIKFINLNTGKEESSPQHNCNIYYSGPNRWKFAIEFEEVGFIRRPA